MDQLKEHVLLRASKKTGKVVTCLTGIGSGMMKLWGLQNTTRSKRTIIIERESGKVIAEFEGAAGGPEIKRGDLGRCDEYGVPLEALADL